MRSLIAILSLLGMTALSAQPAVNLYLEPEASAVAFQTVPLSEAEALAPEHPVMNGKVDNDWYRIAYPGHYVGFVQTAATNSDGTFNPGARLFIRKSTDSGIIARIQIGDNAKVIDRSGQWSTVSYQGKGHVYYRNPEIFSPLPSVAAAQRPVSVSSSSTPAVISTPAGSANASGMAVSTIPVTQQGGEIIAVEELEVVEAVPAAPAPKAPVATAPRPAPAPQQAPVTTPRPKLPAPGYAPVLPSSPSQNNILSREVPSFYEGTFSRVSGFNLNFFGPDYKFVLTDKAGKRFAYVDIENALMVSPIEAYLNKPVIVEGVPEKVGGTVPIVIRAKFVRLTH
ncbi:MAG: hypothetical protein ACQKBW_06785 [Puniceicoccales bacterium]